MYIYNGEPLVYIVGSLYVYIYIYITVNPWLNVELLTVVPIFL